MWPFSKKQNRAVVVFHIDPDGVAQGAYFKGDADVLVIDERDPRNRVVRMNHETATDELRRKIGKHPIRKVLENRPPKRHEPAMPTLSLHWDGRGGAAA